MVCQPFQNNLIDEKEIKVYTFSKAFLSKITKKLFFYLSRKAISKNALNHSTFLHPSHAEHGGYRKREIRSTVDWSVSDVYENKCSKKKK